MGRFSNGANHRFALLSLETIEEPILLQVGLIGPKCLDTALPGFVIFFPSSFDLVRSIFETWLAPGPGATDLLSVESLRQNGRGRRGGIFVARICLSVAICSLACLLCLLTNVADTESVQTDLLGQVARGLHGVEEPHGLLLHACFGLVSVLASVRVSDLCVQVGGRTG